MDERGFEPFATDLHVPDLATLASERAEEIRSGAVPLAPLEDVVGCLMESVANDSINGQIAVVDRGRCWDRSGGGRRFRSVP